jgi:hypothetical protein
MDWFDAGASHLTPIGKRAIEIRNLVSAGFKADDWSAIDNVLAQIDQIADELTAW